MKIFGISSWLESPAVSPVGILPESERSVDHV